MSATTPRGPYLVGAPSERRCWTCRDRKLSCDLGRPYCQNCATSGRTCLGYGLRLSWPANGSRRSSTAAVPSHGTKATHFINTLMPDVEFYMHPDNLAKLPIRNSRTFPLSNLANAQPVMGDGHHLVTYFMVIVIRSLSPIREDGDKLWKLLFQLSFSDDSAGSMAVLRAMLSLASLYRYGQVDEALRLKVAALNSLNASMKGDVTTTEIYQHTAVGMLLCAFEVFIPSESSFQWPLYVSGAKSMLHKICDGGHPKLMEVDFLVLWVHYHDILGKFTSRHWKVQSAENASLFKIPGMASTLVSSVANESVLGIFGCSLEMINIIARMSNITPDTKKPDSVQYAEQNILTSIEHDLMTIKQDTTYLQGTISPEEVDHASKISQLYRLSALIYFERVLRNSSTGRLTRWVAEAFELIPQLSLCERPFPLFFVACEANTELQRGLILSLLRRTEQQSSQWRLHDLQGMIESMWVQHDLSADLEAMNYVELLNAVVSSSKLLPTLA